MTHDHGVPGKYSTHTSFFKFSPIDIYDYEMDQQQENICSEVRALLFFLCMFS